MGATKIHSLAKPAAQGGLLSDTVGRDRGIFVRFRGRGGTRPRSSEDHEGGKLPSFTGASADKRISRATAGHGVADAMETVLSRVGGAQSPALVELAAATQTGSYAPRAGSAQASLVSTNRALHFELSRAKSCSIRGAERLYRTARAWFTPAVFERTVSRALRSQRLEHEHGRSRCVRCV